MLHRSWHLATLSTRNQTTDIYAIGILLFQCIVGHVPFEGPSHEVLEKQVHKKLPLQLIKDKGLRNIVECATDKNQKVRYQTASQMRVAMENLDGSKREMKKSTKMALVSAIGVAVVVVLGLAGFFFHNHRQAEQEAMARTQAMNDSLRVKVSEATSAADAQFALGQKHDEGYDEALVEAFNGYAHAIGTASKITDNNVDTKPIVAKQEKAKAALLNAKKELADKEKLFKEEGMADIASEFDKRIKRIDEVLK